MVWQRKAYDTQQSYWRGSTKINMDDQLRISQGLAQVIESIRSDTRSQLKAADLLASSFEPNKDCRAQIVDFIDCVKDTSVSCTDKMILLSKTIMESSVKITVEPPPCAFSVVAIGSLARGEATPYSDLEYMFLIEIKTPEIEEYFERLAVTSYFLMGNLGETKLSYMAIAELRGWFEDKSKNGFKIDGLSPGAGNIPTGNGNPITKNHFIVTPKEMAVRYQNVLNNPDKKEALRGDLTAMLAYMKSIYSHQNGSKLLSELKRRLSKMSPNSQRREMNMEMLKNDMAKFDFKPDFNLRNKGFTVDVKKELYRFPSLLLYDVSIIFYKHGDSVWETVENLHECELISDQIRLSILFQLACACYVRLSTYLYHDSHDDRVSVAPTMAAHQCDINPSKSQARWVVPGNLLHTMCQHMVPLKQRLAQGTNILEVLKSRNIEPDWFTAIEILYSCGRYKGAYELLKELFGEDLLNDTPEFVKVLRETDHPFPDLTDLIGNILHDCGEYKLAMGVYNNNPFTNSMGANDSRKISCNFHMNNINGATEVAVGAVEPLCNSVVDALKANKGIMQEHRRKLKASGKENDTGAYLDSIVNAISDVSKKTDSSTSAHMELKNMAHMCNRFVTRVMSRPGATYLDMLEGGMVYSLEISLKEAVDIDSYSKLRLHDQVNTFLQVDHELDESDVDLLSMTPMQRLDQITEQFGTTKQQYMFMGVILKLGELYCAQGKHELADAYLQACLPMLAELCGEDALVQEAGLIYGTLGKNSMAVGQRTKAREYLNKAITIYSELHGPTAAHVAELGDMLTELDVDSIAISAYADEELD